MNSDAAVGDFFYKNYSKFKEVTVQDMRNLDEEIKQYFGCDFKTFIQRTRIESEFEGNDENWKEVKRYLTTTDIINEYTSYYYVKNMLRENKSPKIENQAIDLNPSNNLESKNNQEKESTKASLDIDEIDNICQTYFGVKALKFESVTKEYIGSISKKVTPKEFKGIASDNYVRIVDKVVERDVELYQIFQHIQRVKNDLVPVNNSKLPSNSNSDAHNPETYLECIFGYMKTQAERLASMENKIVDCQRQNRQIETLLEKLTLPNYTTSTTSYSPSYERPKECSKCRKLADSNEELSAQLKKEQLLNKKLEEEKAELAQKIELLLQQKRTEELTKKGDIMNSNSSKKLEEIKKVIAQYSNNCMSFIDGLNIEDNYIADVFEHFIRYSISSAFCLKTDLPEIIKKATETFKQHAPFIQNYMELVFEFIRKEITTIYQVMEGADNFKLGWFEKSQNLEKDYEIKGDVNLTDSSSTFFTCMYPSILFGEKCFVIGNATKVHP